MTRIAGANPRIWVDILLDNREELAAALAEHRRRVEQVGGRARLRRRRLSGPLDRRGQRATVGACWRPPTRTPARCSALRVHVPDRPGVLAGIFQALGAERINVADFELDHRSHEQGGTLTILVSGEADAQRAAELLEAQGYGAVVAPVIGE